MASRSRTARPKPSAASPTRAHERLVARVNRELYKRNAELAVRNKTLALLRTLDEISMATLGLEEMAGAMAREIAQALGFDVVSLAVVDGRRNVCRWLGIASPAPALDRIFRGTASTDLAVPLKGTQNACVRALRRRTPEYVRRVADAFPQPLAAAMTRARALPAGQLESSLVYPLRLGPRALGALVVSAGRDLRSLSRYERESLLGLTSLIAIAVEKAQIYEELQRTTAELRDANAQLAQLDKAKSEFLSIASHQLYTPMTAIRGYLSMTQEGDFGGISEKLQPIVTILRKSADRMVDLIRTLLDISRIESGRLQLNPESVDLVKMADELVTELRPNAGRKQQTFAFRRPPMPVPLVVGDAQRLRQILLNTVDNAIKYTPEGGNVEVAVRAEGSNILFSVRDTGRGMTSEEIARLFTKFTRVGKEEEKYRTEGAGLGLYLARRIVLEHRGDIWAESPGRGKGATFFVRFPAEGARDALRAGEKITVSIKAAEAGQRPDEASAEAGEAAP